MQPITFTEEQVYELVTSSKSCSYFARNFVFPNVDSLTLDQLKWLECEGGNTKLGSGRCTYRTTTMLAKALWTFIFKPEKTTMYLTPKQALAQSARYEFSRMYEQLPDYMKGMLKVNNRDQMVNDNYSTVIIKTATANSTRGRGINLLLLDNTLHMNRNEYNELMYCVLPTIGTGDTLLEAY